MLSLVSQLTIYPTNQEYQYNRKENKEFHLASEKVLKTTNTRQLHLKGLQISVLLFAKKSTAMGWNIFSKGSVSHVNKCRQESLRIKKRWLEEHPYSSAAKNIEIGAIYIHKETQVLYCVDTLARTTGKDPNERVIYHSLEDGEVWDRSVIEFHNVGRFIFHTNRFAGYFVRFFYCFKRILFK